MLYTYECQGKVKDLKDDQETHVEHNRYFVVRCEECCNVPVYHMIDRKQGEM
jgi:hypothetical protein